MAAVVVVVVEVMQVAVRPRLIQHALRRHRRGLPPRQPRDEISAQTAARAEISAQKAVVVLRRGCG